ncbi:hypothetical protein [Burkholderia sp. Bp9142]|uniref:hypothetical protein n=1 Tax=Burkholderia sp. Bp9142 TaxID=2184573 RepID=UPI000F598F8B|nr:hypothetical protein [Burkholderia sp. Bp9142]RQR29412.1 hypothetical protein DIE22_26180 [Burkholderia sp. Bp9142]
MRKLYKVKRTYSLDEAAERLSLTLDEPVTQADIIRLMADGELGIFWCLEDVPLRPITPYTLLGDTRAVCLDTVDGATIKYLSGVFRVDMQVNSTAREWVRKLASELEWSANWSKSATVLVGPDGSIWELMKHDPQQGLSGQDNFHWDPRFPELAEIVVIGDELERFESRFSSPERQLAGGETVELSSKERATFQKVAGVLALTLAKQANRYRNGDAPNANQIAAAVGEILDALPDANRHGLSSSNIRATIKAGLELLIG